jgi:Flp pilus assembly protein TadD
LRRAIALDPKDARPHHNLGRVLGDQGKFEEAAAEFRRAIALDPKDALAHHGLGLVLRDQGKLPEAAAEYGRAIALDPKLAGAHNDLGNVLHDQGKLAEATAEYRRAIALDPKDARPHFGLGIVLSGQGKREEAAAEYRQVLRLKEDYAEAHCNLGHLLQQQGQLAEALAELKRGHELGSRLGQRWKYPSAEWVRQCQRLLDLEARRPEALQGQAQPADAAAAQKLNQANLSSAKQRHAAAARWYAEAFEAQPELADDLQGGHRHKAARAAALAGCGQGEDAKALDEKERARLRKQALYWLRGDLSAWRAQLDQGPGQAQTVGQQMQHWLTDTNLAGVRAPEALGRLPEAERRRWQRLWQDVAALRDQAGGKGATQK